MQSEMKSVQGENEHLKAQLKAAILELEGKETETRTMQEQLKAAESFSSSLAEALSSAKSSWASEVEGLQEELTHLKAKNIEGQKDLTIQLNCVRKLKDELSGVHGETYLLHEERELGRNEIVDVRKEASGHFNQLEVARKRECEKDAEILELSSLAETLRQSLLAKDLENSNLLEALRKSTECQNAAEKRFMDEIGFLQGEEIKLRTDSALMAEKVASLRMENAALHQDLSLKVELVWKQQQEVESLTEKCRSLSQELHDMSVEMLDLKNDLQIFKDVVIPSMEERAVELQDEITSLTVSNERHVAEIVSLRRRLKDAKSDLLLLHEENSVLRIELIFNVEMMKYVDVVFGTAKTQTETLCDKRGLEEKSAREELLSPHKNSTESNLTQDRVDDIQRLKEENQNLIEEIQSLKGQSLAAWTERNLIENTVRDLQASRAVLEEKNGYLKSEVSSCKEHIVRLEEEMHVLQQKHAELVQDVEASIPQDRVSLARGKSARDKAVWAAFRRSSTALEVQERAGRRKAAGCWACVSNTSRQDSFDDR